MGDSLAGAGPSGVREQPITPRRRRQPGSEQRRLHHPDPAVIVIPPGPVL